MMIDECINYFLPDRYRDEKVAGSLMDGYYFGSTTT
jgi:hypothetical protein